MVRRRLAWMLLVPVSLILVLQWREIPATTENVRHLLSRTSFGLRAGDLERVRSLGISSYLEEQLDPSSIDDSGLEERLSAYPLAGLSARQLFEIFPPYDPRALPSRLALLDMELPQDPVSAAPMSAEGASAAVPRQLRKARIVRAIHSRRQLQEVMTDFWMNHFNVFVLNGRAQFLPDFENRTIRPAALGRFEDLLVAVAQSPAMLFYLDNWLSSVDAKTIEARALKQQPALSQSASETGRIPGLSRWKGVTPAVRRARGLNENFGRELLELHTVGLNGGYTESDVIEVAKAFTGWTLLDRLIGGGFYFQPLMHHDGSKTIMGRTFSEAGLNQGLEILRFLARHPSTARHLATKLVRRFVADEPPQDLVDMTADAFSQSNGDIRYVLNTLFTAPGFYRPQFRGAKVKKPLELVASTMRAVDGEWEDYGILAQVSGLGEVLYGRATPDGYPDRADYWISSTTLAARLQFAGRVATRRAGGLSLNPELGLQVGSDLGITRPDATQKGQIGRWLARGAARPIPERQAQLAFLLGSPEFQKR